MTEPEAPSRADATRARLLSAAAAAFAERGFHGTTTRDIASAAGMSPAAVYVHYKSKEQLLHQLSRVGHQRIIDAIDAVDDHADTPARRLTAAMRAFATHHASSHTSVRVVNYELDALTEEHRAEIGGLRREITRRLRAIVDAGVADGSFDTPDPRMATIAVLSSGIDIGRWYHDGGEITPDRIGDFYADLALRTVGANTTDTPK
ncbi:TetR/AcrR family transcriptional regulator [Tsukamurella ocularis]|uniref:TetR/AcrR family transcriptional regulator n=1 Tax=Tsukamurella ocularis TaxID=1970234 RepID=UPI002166DE3E|nr:TetR/AcrR family transcriptional regulator [Tsukamurella ocularis]MCS3780082.1 AcrR family transcriptional regulator [Tsukamurella ocularis]MCS3786364.1 AcrR family transcriptional regulator [Tsukamurella ocularis]MCS3849728.1 AcrR family transcriptional regulator [Tsukamurella ocularis]